MACQPRAHCEVAVLIAQRLGVGVFITNALSDVLERWDGSGFPNQKAREQIHPGAQLVAVASAIEIFTRMHGVVEGLNRVRLQAAQLFDPSLLSIVTTKIHGVLDALSLVDAWTSCVTILRKTELADSPMSPDEMTAILSDYAELKIPRSVGASTLAADIFLRAADDLGLKDYASAHRAIRLHGLGRISVANATLDRVGHANHTDAESIRLSPYWGARILSRSTLLSIEAGYITRAYERCDTSGYPFGLLTSAHQVELLLLQAVVAYVDRVKPWRLHPPSLHQEAIEALRQLVSQGALDARCVAAISDQAMGKKHRGEVKQNFNIDLTQREIEVLQHLCLGQSNKQIAKTLDISPKTVGAHVEHIYSKLGVSTRAAATMKALQRRLIHGSALT
jgi:DNA-binding CsgD family transcriptional regulator